MGLGGISIWQLLIILVIVLVLFGTKRLRNIGSDLGSAFKGFKKSMSDEEKSEAPKVEKTEPSKDESVIEGESVQEKEKEKKEQPRTRDSAMFDIGFFELILIGVVALLVIGPERLPHVARTAGKWLGRARRFVGSVKADIEQEIKAEELKKILEQQKQSNPLHEIVEDTKDSFEDIKKQTESGAKSAQDAVKDAGDDERKS